MRSAIFSVLLLSGCQAMIYGTASSLDRIEVGMTKDQVISALGSPSYVLSGNAPNEVRMQYNRMAAITSWSPDTYEVVLRDGRVSKFGKPTQ